MYHAANCSRPRLANTDTEFPIFEVGILLCLEDVIESFLW